SAQLLSGSHAVRSAGDVGSRYSVDECAAGGRAGGDAREAAASDPVRHSQSGTSAGSAVIIDVRSAHRGCKRRSGNRRKYSGGLPAAQNGRNNPGPGGGGKRPNPVNEKIVILVERRQASVGLGSPQLGTRPFRRVGGVRGTRRGIVYSFGPCI